MTRLAIANAPPAQVPPPPLPAPMLHGLRLALFTDTYAPQVNGVTRTLERLVDEVRRRGGACKVFSVQAAGTPRPAAVRWRSVPFWAYPELRLAWPGKRAALAELRRFRPTLVHAATPAGVGLAGRSAARALGVPLVASYHTHLAAYAAHYGLGALAGPGWQLLRWFHAGAVRTYCPTRAVADQLASRGFDRLAVWRRGVDTTRYSPAHRSHAFRAWLGVGPHELLVLHVGRLAAEKDIEVALDAGRRLLAASRTRIRLVLVGDGPHAAECQQRAPGGTIFTGRLEGERLAAAYASADLFVFPSRTDTFGNVLLEAMASGVPVVGADLPTTREVLGEAGHFFTPGDPAALANSLLRLSMDSNARGRAAALGLAVARRSTWSAAFDALFADYVAIARRDRAEAAPPATSHDAPPLAPWWRARASAGRGR